jgi:DNA-binding transcriptional ArsR family regulator
MQDAALRAIASPRRRAILRLIWTRELTSRDIASHFDVTWPAISQNLRVLEGAGLVRARNEGTTRYYRADKAGVGPLKSILMKMWEDDIDRLAMLAEEEERRGR